MTPQESLVFPEIFSAFPDVDGAPAELSFTGDEQLPSWFKVTDLAAESIAAAGLMLQRRIPAHSPPLHVDRRLASLWFGKTIRPVGWELPPPWDSIAGNYQAKDGWVRLHTNAALHKQATLSVLDCENDRDAVTATAQGWSADELAEAVIAAGGCATAMRTPQAWQAHPQGQTVAAEPLIHWDLLSDTQHDLHEVPAVNPKRPLQGIKVLDLTRILAGPIATRFLAAYGADVLRIDPPGWDEPSTAPEVTLGKQCAGLNLRDPTDKAIFENLLQQADLLVHGYRPGALAGLGYDSVSLRQINPRLVDVSLCAYGWTGPWAGRRGFDSVVQMSCGIAAYGMQQAGAAQPVSLPVQALDHATGYLIAAAAIHALNLRDTQGAIYSARLSLARTASLLMTRPADATQTHFSHESEQDIDPTIESTEWGDARRIRFPLEIAGVPAKWDFPAGSLQASAAKWSQG